MRYLAININYRLDQDWYCRLNTIMDCHQYFNSLGPEHGPSIAIYDTEIDQYLWLQDSYQEDDPRLKGIITNAKNARKVGV